MKIVILLVAVAYASAAVYLDDNFADGTFDDWVVSTNKGAEAGKFELKAGEFSDPENVGLKTMEDARFYQISKKLDQEFSNKDNTLVLQYSVRHEQNIDCGGGYIKLIPAGLDQGNFNGDDDYNIMFGPDICGSSTRKVHVIFNYKGENHLIDKTIRCETDTTTHLYTLIVNPDNTYEVRIDNEEVESGSLSEDWDIIPPKMIKDPEASKPDDHDEREQIPDPEAVKPEGWDDVPAEIADPDAEMPEDWDEELDGEWEAPLIDNPEYQGEWEAPLIDNPDYDGVWIHPEIENPDYFEDDQIYAFDSHAFIGLEIWQVKAGTIFDNFLVTDDIATAEEAAESILKDIEEEKTRKAADDEAKRAAEAEDEEEDIDDFDLDDLEELDEFDEHDEL